MLNALHRKADAEDIIGKPVLLCIVPAAEEQAEQTANQLWNCRCNVSGLLQTHRSLTLRLSRVGSTEESTRRDKGTAQTWAANQAPASRDVRQKDRFILRRG